MIHALQITLESALPRQVVEQRLEALAAGGPFAVRGLTPSGAGRWAITLRTARPGLAVRSVKVAELLVLVAREFELHAVQRLPSASVAAAS
jgi:hypothetical protein